MSILISLNFLSHFDTFLGRKLKKDIYEAYSFKLGSLNGLTIEFHKLNIDIQTDLQAWTASEYLAPVLVNRLYYNDNRKIGFAFENKNRIGNYFPVKTEQFKQ